MLINTIIIFLLAMLLLPLHAYLSFCLALPTYLRSKIFWGGIRTGIFIGLYLAGFFLWGRVGFIFLKWSGAIIFFIFYLMWGLLWHWRGMKKFAKLRSEEESSPEFQKSMKELNELEKEAEDELKKELKELLEEKEDY